MKVQYIGVTRLLAISGATDNSFCDEEAAHRGREVHRAIKLFEQHRLDEKHLPKHVRAFLEGYKQAKNELHLIIKKVEIPVMNKKLGIRGRLDAECLKRGVRALADWKTNTTGIVDPATGLQLCLYGDCYTPGVWWPRLAVVLMPEDFRYHEWPLKTFGSDLVTAKAAHRMAHWRLLNRKDSL